ncbi:hypothetical protein MGG_01143 [Pyricularia oryzae 70-15]|uniref:Uncharacterized protein n=3 Tax=Pyricularia oryzae TaxID=318829 RepID=G4NBZ4_PYRO7|nr:uncharacterized protein MGG_01143 [Pyricularia oryzae 70-15]EHA48196.1 hypothetical protein MGG_01143 [Pyricularia oryzae 70-15]
MTLLGPMNVLSAVSEQLQGPISATTLPACCQAAGVRGTGACATWSANKTSHKRLAQASEDQLLGVKLGRIFAASGFRIADLEVQSSDRSLVKSSTQPRTALSSCPATPMERTPSTIKNAPFARISVSPVSPACTDSDQQQDSGTLQTQDDAVLDSRIVSGSPQCHQSSNCVISVPDKSIDICRNNHARLLSEQRFSGGVVQKTTKNPRSRSDVDGPHTAEVPKKRRRLSWNQTTSPLSEPSSTPWSIKLSASATAGRSETGPDGWKQARLSQGALARRQIFLMGMHRQRAEVQEADGQIVERMKRGNNEMSRTEEFRAIDADPQTDTVGMESLGAPDVGSSQISTETAGGINSSGGVKCGTRQLRQCVNTNVSALHTEKPSDRTPSQSRAVRDPAAHLAAARAQITSRPFMSSTRPVPLSGQSRSPLVIFRPGQPLANMQMTSWVIPLPPFCSSTGTATPQSSLASTKEEIDSEEKEEEEEDENELAFPTFKYESRYFANDCEDDGMEIYADLAGLWPQSGDGFPADMDAEYEEMGTFGISTFG